MAKSTESLSSQVKKLKADLATLKGGKAAEVAKKRKKKPVAEKDVLRVAKKRLRRASRRMLVEKARAGKAAKGKGEAAAT